MFISTNKEIQQPKRISSDVYGGTLHCSLRILCIRYQCVLRSVPRESVKLTYQSVVNAVMAGIRAIFGKVAILATLPKIALGKSLSQQHLLCSPAASFNAETH